LLMLCMEVGSDGLRTAKWFGQHFKVPSTIVNGYINKQSEVPRFGQLGCGGFIVLGPSGRVRVTPDFTFLPKRKEPVVSLQSKRS